MAWMMDTYSMSEGATATGVVAGKPVSLGGSLGQIETTGRGVFVVGCETARDLGFNVTGSRVTIEGLEWSGAPRLVFSMNWARRS